MKGARVAGSGRYGRRIVVVGTFGADVDHCGAGGHGNGGADHAVVPPVGADHILNHVKVDETLDFAGFAVDEANLVVARIARRLEFQLVALVAVDQ